MVWQLSVINGGQSRPAPLPAAAHQPDLAAAAWPTFGHSAELSLWDQQLGQVWPVRAHRVRFGPAPGWPVVGDFNGDGYSELGLYCNGHWYIDLNGNGRWDDDDLWILLGDARHIPVVGDWDGDGKTDIGVFGPAPPEVRQAALEAAGLPHPHNSLAGVRKNAPLQTTATTRLMRHTARGTVRADRIDHAFLFGEPGDWPIVGDWSQSGADSIGVFRNGLWILDVDGDGRFSAGDESFQFGQPGDVPVVADFRGDGQPTLGVYRAGQWWFDTDGDRQLGPGDRTFPFGTADDLPLIGDWDGDGRDQVGVYVRIAR